MEDLKEVKTEVAKNIDPVKVLAEIEEKTKKSKDLKTTIAGTITAVATAAISIPGPHTLIASAVVILSGTLFAWWSKDK